MKPIAAAAALAAAFAASPALAHPGGHGEDAEFPPTRNMPRALAVPSVAARSVPIELTARGGCAPQAISAKAGETLRLVVRNAGTAEQELAVGAANELKAYADVLRQFPQMQMPRTGRVSVKPGETAELLWQPREPGEFSVACGAPGRFDAALAGKVTVTAQ